MSKYDQLETSSLDAADSSLPVTANLSGDAHDLPVVGCSALVECSASSPVATPCSSAEAKGLFVITPTSLALGGGASVNPSSSSTNAVNQQSFLPGPTTPTAGADFPGFSTDPDTLCARLEEVMRRDPVAALRGREFTVKRSSGALQSDWQLVFGAQVHQEIEKVVQEEEPFFVLVQEEADEEDEEYEEEEQVTDVVECYQASSRTHRPCAVRSLQKYNAALFQEAKSGASAVDSAAPMPPLYRAELLYMLACQEPDAERKGDADADFTEVCA